VALTPVRSTQPRIAVFAGPTATILSSPPLVTSQKARRKYGLPPRRASHGQPIATDVLRPQRLARPVTVYVEQFSAHPLEADAAELYAPPDGYLDAAGTFHLARTSPEDTPVYEVELDPSDGLYPLPYPARQADGTAWEGDGAVSGDRVQRARQPFYPDASRVFEEIDRLALGEDGLGSALSSRARFDFFRVLPSGGYTKGLPDPSRTDSGSGHVPPETLGVDYFPYRPTRYEPSVEAFAKATTALQEKLSRDYAGAVWLEGSAGLEETLYWLGLTVDTTVPIVGVAGRHGGIPADGDQNVIDAVDYILSGIWTDEAGRDAIGAVAVLDERVFTAREVQKADERPGGYVATGGHGGIVATMGHAGGAVLTFRPVRKHTWRSAVRATQVPRVVQGVKAVNGEIVAVPVPVRDPRGGLEPGAMPSVTIVKHARYLARSTSEDPAHEVEILARIAHNMRQAPLAGFVLEGTAPYGDATRSIRAALRVAALSGMPVVRVSRGNAGGMVTPARPEDLLISGSNLTSTKARILLIACLLTLGGLPPARDPLHPTSAEVAAVAEKVARLQQVFDTH
jgi:L-asparaginase